MVRQAMRLTLLATLCATGLAGCASSPPTEFITLNARKTQATPLVRGTHETVPITLGVIQLPATLDRPALVRRAGSNRLKVDGTIQWAAPLDTLVRDTLASDLAARFPADTFIMPQAPKPHRFRLLLVNFQTFSAGPANRVRLQARWRLLNAQTQHTITASRETIAVPAHSSQGGDIASAMSRALDEFAKRVAAKIRPKD